MADLSDETILLIIGEYGNPVNLTGDKFISGPGLSLFIDDSLYSDLPRAIPQKIKIRWLAYYAIPHDYLQRAFNCGRVQTPAPIRMIVN